MKTNLFLLLSILIIIVFISCEEKRIRYELYSNDKLAFEILPKDIEFYDTTQIRNGIEIHELRLRDSFYKEDTLRLVYPMYLYCYIDGEKYFWSDYFRATQSQSRLWVNFHFRSSCENIWTFPERKVDRYNFQYLENGDSLVFSTKNKCNSIEFFHKKKHISESLNDYYMKREYFRNYIDTARLAHEILYDPYYLDALKESGVEIR